MNSIQKVLAIAALTSSVTADEVQNLRTNLVVNAVSDSFDVAAMEQKIKDDVTNELQNMNLEAKIKAEIDKKANELVQEQIHLQEKWNELRAYEKAAWDKFEKMTMKAKLADVMNSFSDPSQSQEIWGDFDNEHSAPGNITLHIDAANKAVGVFSDDVDAKGRPVMQWEMNTETGHITETKRAVDGTEVQITQKDIDVATLDKELNDKKIDEEAKDTKEWVETLEQKVEENVPADVTTNATVEVAAAPEVAEVVAEAVDNATAESKASEATIVEDEWNDLEKQRDIAFKIMYFFIVFIIATFSLLYAFFRMTQNSEQEAAQRKGAVKGQRQPVHDQQQTFFNFLAGQLDDENYVVNPYARKQATQVSSQFTSASTPFANLAAQGYSKAQQMARKAQNSKTQSEQNYQVADHRQNNGFGANNLVHLSNEERGRFDDIEINNDQKPNLANFPQNNL